MHRNFPDGDEGPSDRPIGIPILFPDPMASTARAACAVLDQGTEFLDPLPPALYRQPTRAIFNASLGAHYRHCLEHFSSLLGGLDRGLINYDDRPRQARLETDPLFAVDQTRRLRTRLELLSPSDEQRMVQVRGLVTPTGPTVDHLSTVGRELSYAVAHTIHHYALMAVLAATLGATVPAGFGVAPSTAAYWREQEESKA